MVKGKEQTENENANGQSQTERPSEILENYYFRQDLKKQNKEKHQSDSLKAKYKIESDSILLHSTVHTM